MDRGAVGIAFESLTQQVHREGLAVQQVGVVDVRFSVHSSAFRACSHERPREVDRRSGAPEPLAPRRVPQSGAVHRGSQTEENYNTFYFALSRNRRLPPGPSHLPSQKGISTVPVMKMGEGVEWSLHCCVTLTWAEEHWPVPIARLAAWFDLPVEYLKKRLQALVRAGILTSAPGVRGGFGLARPPEQITLLDVVTAIEGGTDPFRCTEIRQRGHSGRTA